MPGAGSGSGWFEPSRDDMDIFGPFALKSLLLSLSRLLLGVLLGIPALLYPLLYFRQEAMLFLPRGLDESEEAWLRGQYPGSEFTLDPEPGIRLHGWLRKGAPSAPLLLYFGGNAEEVSHQIDMPLPPGWSLLLMNYRGYGKSQGRPGQAALFQDALAIYDTLKKDFPRIALMGRSLGTGVAVYVASRRPVCSAVLVSPYDSIRQLAQDLYPYVPVRWLLKHPFDARKYAPEATTPVLALIADADEIIPPDHSQRLLASWGGEVHVHRFPRADHTSIAEEADFWPTIRGFLATHSRCLDGGSR